MSQERAVTTPLSTSTFESELNDAVGISLRWNYCPDEEGIETLRGTYARAARTPIVGITALMKKGLKPFRTHASIRLSCHCWNYCPDEEGIET